MKNIKKILHKIRYKILSTIFELQFKGYCWLLQKNVKSKYLDALKDESDYYKPRGIFQQSEELQSTSKTKINFKEVEEMLIYYNRFMDLVYDKLQESGKTHEEIDKLLWSNTPKPPV